MVVYEKPRAFVCISSLSRSLLIFPAGSAVLIRFMQCVLCSPARAFGSGCFEPRALYRDTALRNSISIPVPVSLPCICWIVVWAILPLTDCCCMTPLFCSLDFNKEDLIEIYRRKNSHIHFDQLEPSR